MLPSLIFLAAGAWPTITSTLLLITDSQQRPAPAVFSATTTVANDANESNLERAEAEHVNEDADAGTAEEEMPFDRVDLQELEAAASAHREDRVTLDTEPRMSPVGVHDPFPDRVQRTPPREVWIPATIGLGLAGASVVMARLALLPDCGTEDDITTCNAPTDGDIGARGGRVFGAVGFGVGGAAFGVIAARHFGHWLDQNPRLSLQRKRRIAIGTGTTAVILGAAGIAAGASLFGVSTRRAVDIGREFEDADIDNLSDEESAQLNAGLNEVRRARVGLMVLVATPTLFATGVSLLVHRPRAKRLSVTPALSPTYAGISLQGRF